MNKPQCNQGHDLKFRGWSNRYPPKSEALADCLVCGEKYQIRYFNGVQSSEPYQCKAKAQKTQRGSWRLEPKREAAIVAIYGSVQEYLDNGALVCMPVQLIR